MGSELDIGALRAFVCAVRAGSISRAATTLDRTQPALSQQLRKLERAVGRQLLHRSPTGVTPTPAGAEFVTYAERILVLSTQAITATGQALVGRCVVAMLEDLAASQLAQALADLARLHPEATLEVLSLPTAALRDAYDAGRVHLVLDEIRALPAAPRWTVPRPLVWALGREVDLEADPLPVVVFSNPCVWRTAVLDTLDRADRRWQIRFESNSLSGVLAALRAGLGVTALMPANTDLTMTIRDPDVLPSLPDVEIGLSRHPGSEGDPLIDAVEGTLRAAI